MKNGWKGGFTISGTLFCAKGIGLNADMFTQGISPLEDRAGVAEWQTSSVPIDATAL